jgi:hypothetical protein
MSWVVANVKPCGAFNGPVLSGRRDDIHDGQPSFKGPSAETDPRCTTRVLAGPPDWAFFISILIVIVKISSFLLLLALNTNKFKLYIFFLFVE